MCFKRQSMMLSFLMDKGRSPGDMAGDRVYISEDGGRILLSHRGNNADGKLWRAPLVGGSGSKAWIEFSSAAPPFETSLSVIRNTRCHSHYSFAHLFPSQISHFRTPPSCDNLSPFLHHYIRMSALSWCIQQLNPVRGEYAGVGVHTTFSGPVIEGSMSARLHAFLTCDSAQVAGKRTFSFSFSSPLCCGRRLTSHQDQGRT
jgi:hypothetical protein